MEQLQTEGRVRLPFRVLPNTLDKLMVHGLIEKAKKVGSKRSIEVLVSMSLKAVEILDEWAETQSTPDEERRSTLPALRSVRRLQVTGWVRKTTSLAIRKVALDLNLSDSALAGIIVDLWAEGLVVSSTPEVKVVSREKLREYQRKYLEKKKKEREAQA